MSPDTIGTLAVTWRPDAPPDPERIDRLVRDLVAELVELPGGGDDEVCLREVVVPLRRFSWDEADGRLVTAWADALVDAVGAAVAGAVRVRVDAEPPAPPGAAAVRYASRATAVTDAAVGLLTGDTDRAWAWAQLGLWPTGAGLRSSGDAVLASEVVADHVTEVLLAAPPTVIPVLLALARRGALHATLRRLGDRRATALVEAAWRAAGGRTATPLAVPAVPISEATALADRSPLADALARWAATGSPRSVHAGRATAAARLVVLDVEPSLARRDERGELVAEVAAAVLARPRPPEPTALPDTPPAVVTGAIVPDAHRPPVPAPPPPPPPIRTAWGGLLFLLHLVEDEPPHALLHALGVDLLARLDPDVAPRDPALLAFCGVGPHAEPPPPEDGTQEAAADAAVVLLERLLARVEVDPLLPPTALLDLVVRRPAVVEFEPGWLELVFDVDDVVTEVRRAGLDLDLGHVPWLGCVVRFRYV